MNVRQRGLTTVEMAVTAGLAIGVLIATIEVMRAFFIMNAIGEGTRRAARQAVVCPINDASVKDALLSMPGAAIPGLQASNINVTYLTAAGGPAAGVADARFVQVEITGAYSVSVLVPSAPSYDATSRSVPVPAFRTTLPVESLGYLPESGGYGCLGT